MFVFLLFNVNFLLFLASPVGVSMLDPKGVSMCMNCKRDSERMKKLVMKVLFSGITHVRIGYIYLSLPRMKIIVNEHELKFW